MSQSPTWLTRTQDQSNVKQDMFVLAQDTLLHVVRVACRALPITLGAATHGSTLTELGPQLQTISTAVLSSLRQILQHVVSSGVLSVALLAAVQSSSPSNAGTNIPSPTITVTRQRRILLSQQHVALHIVLHLQLAMQRATLAVRAAESAMESEGGGVVPFRDLPDQIAALIVELATSFPRWEGAAPDLRAQIIQRTGAAGDHVKAAAIDCAQMLSNLIVVNNKKVEKKLDRGYPRASNPDKKRTYKPLMPPHSEQLSAIRLMSRRLVNIDRNHEHAYMLDSDSGTATRNRNALSMPVRQLSGCLRLAFRERLWGEETAKHAVHSACQHAWSSMLKESAPFRCLWLQRRHAARVEEKVGSETASSSPEEDKESTLGHIWELHDSENALRQRLIMRPSPLTTDHCRPFYKVVGRKHSGRNINTTTAPDARPPPPPPPRWPEPVDLSKGDAFLQDLSALFVYTAPADDSRSMVANIGSLDAPEDSALSITHEWRKDFGAAAVRSRLAQGVAYAEWAVADKKKQQVPKVAADQQERPVLVPLKCRLVNAMGETRGIMCLTNLALYFTSRSILSSCTLHAHSITNNAYAHACAKT